MQFLPADEAECDRGANAGHDRQRVQDVPARVAAVVYTCRSALFPVQIEGDGLTGGPARVPAHAVYPTPEQTETDNTARKPFPAQELQQHCFSYTYCDAMR